MTEAQIADSFRASNEAFLRQTYSGLFGHRPSWEEMNRWNPKNGIG